MHDGAFIFDVLDLVALSWRRRTRAATSHRSCPCAPTRGVHGACVSAAAPHFVRTLTGPPVGACSMLQSLKSACHGTAMRAVSTAWRHPLVDAKRPRRIVGGIVQHHPADFDAREERPAHTRFERRAVERVRSRRLPATYRAAVGDGS